MQWYETVGEVQSLKIKRNKSKKLDVIPAFALKNWPFELVWTETTLTPPLQLTTIKM